MTISEHIRLIWPNRSFTTIGNRIIITDNGPEITQQMLDDTLGQATYLYGKKNGLESVLKNGFKVDPENFYLSLQDNDRAQFAQMLVLVKEALDLGFINNDTPQSIKDMYGENHIVSTLRFRQIMVAYGFYYKQLWDQLV